MHRRFFVLNSALLLLAATATLAPEPAFGQAVGRTTNAPSGKPGNPPRTAAGQPDLEGIWSSATLTPFERPPEFAGKPYFTREEAAAFEKRTIQQRNADRRDGSGDADLARAYNDAWWDWGTKVAKTLQTSLVVDPPDGRVPPYTPEAQKRIAARAQAIQERCQQTTCVPSVFGFLPADGPEDRSLMDRCLLFPEEGLPMLPTAYNNNYRIVQGPGTVTILMEMIHDARVIPLDGRPHLPQNVRQWLGDSRGHWDGNTLVVDTTNFTSQTRFRNTTRNLHLTERFTRADPETLIYEFTVDDPETFARPWTVSIPMTRTPGPLFEYACHEGNHGLEGMLSGARAQEKAAR
jgi:hypothetical protein